MKRKIFILSAFLPMLFACAANNDADVEKRVEYYLSQMTLEEKVKILHAQSKFSSAGVPRPLWVFSLGMIISPSVTSLTGKTCYILFVIPQPWALLP